MLMLFNPYLEQCHVNADNVIIHCNFLSKWQFCVLSFLFWIMTKSINSVHLKIDPAELIWVEI